MSSIRSPYGWTTLDAFQVRMRLLVQRTLRANNSGTPKSKTKSVICPDVSPGRADERVALVTNIANVENPKTRALSHATAVCAVSQNLGL